jgi:hypothetical protein
MNVILSLVQAFVQAFTRLSASEKEFDQRAENTVYINDFYNNNHDPNDLTVVNDKFEHLMSFITLRSSDVFNATCKEELESKYNNCSIENFMLIYYKKDVHNIVKINREKDLIELLYYISKWERDDLEKLKNLGFLDDDQLYLNFKMMYSSIRRRLCK